MHEDDTYQRSKTTCRQSFPREKEWGKTNDGVGVRESGSLTASALYFFKENLEQTQPNVTIC